MSTVNLILNDQIIFPYETGNQTEPGLERAVAEELFMGLKEVLLMKKLTDAERPNHADGGELQKHFVPSFRGAPYYWLRRPYIQQALELLARYQLVDRTNKGYVNGSGADELFSFGSRGLELIKWSKSSDEMRAYVRQRLIDMAGSDS